MLKEILQNVRKNAPLVHNITNYVTVNDCANILLACGASPIMSDDCGEVEEITSICSALNINIGTLSARTIPAMFMAGKRAAALQHPILLDPVGAGASCLRTDTALQLMHDVRFTAIRGNISEIKALASGKGTTKGVDADQMDRVTEENLSQMAQFAKEFSAQCGAVLVITGAIDIVADAKRAWIIRNGHPMMSRITGSGCMLSAMTAAFLAANPHDVLTACAAAVCAMGLCGELAYERTQSCGGGNAAFRSALIDAVCNLTGEQLEEGAKYEIR